LKMRDGCCTVMMTKAKKNHISRMLEVSCGYVLVGGMRRVVVRKGFQEDRE